MAKGRLGIARVLLALHACALLVRGGLAIAAPATQPLPPIRVSPNGHHFVTADGAPFFWLGDTAWGIFNHATPQDVDYYLDDRAAKGFNVIQGCIALWDYARRPNADGHLPFVDGDPARINEAYFTNVDAVIDKAAARGLYMAILPFWTKNNTTGANLQTVADPEKMRGYCEFITRRYAKKNIFWILGGDWPGANIQPLIDAEAAGLLAGAKAADVEKILISYHPTGKQSSSFWFHDRRWLDFNAIQSGHFINTTNFQIVGKDFEREPAKPTVDTEPGYENITDRLVRNNPNAPRIGADDVRRAAYLAVFAGAAGHTYGQGEVYEFWSPGARTMPGWSAQMPWKTALQLPGSSQMRHLRRLIESRPMLQRIPDQSLIAGEVGDRAVERITATRAADGSYAMIYLPAGRKSVTVQTGQLAGQTLTTWWYNPRDGQAKRIEESPKPQTRQFTAPDDDDWVLVLDDTARRYAAPGHPPVPSPAAPGGG